MRWDSCLPQHFRAASKWGLSGCQSTLQLWKLFKIKTNDKKPHMSERPLNTTPPGVCEKENKILSFFKLCYSPLITIWKQCRTVKDSDCLTVGYILKYLFKMFKNFRKQVKCHVLVICSIMASDCRDLSPCFSSVVLQREGGSWHKAALCLKY